MGFPALGGLDYGAYAIRPYLAGRKKEPSLGLSVLGGEGEGAYAIRPYAFGRKKDHLFGFPALGGEGEGADIFATCLYSFLVTITPRLTFHF